MSNPLKAIGKVFKKVVRVIKKVALPVLAIGAVIVTGGAALGLAPFAGGLAGTLGIGGAIGGVLNAAGTGALIGAIGGAVTGKNILKAATTGMLIGGATGGIGQLTGLMEPVTLASKGLDTAAIASEASGNLANITSNAANAVNTTAPGIGGMIASPAVAAQTAPITVVGNTGSALPQATQAAVNSYATTHNPVIEQPVSQTQQGPPSQGGGIGGFVNRNPYLASTMIQGIGNGISAHAQAKSESKRERQERERIERNYAGSRLFYGPENPSYAVPIERPAEYRWRVDPKTGNLYKERV